MSAPLSRRRLMAISAGTAAAVTAAQLGLSSAASATGSHGVVDHRLRGPADRAYQYLNVVMDAYKQGDDLRLLQSYNNESGLMTTGFIYDNALAAIAYLSRPTSDNVRRAKLIGDTLLWIQANDETHTDGRLRQAYAVGPMIFYGWWPEFPGLVRADGKAAFLWPFGFSGTSVGDMGWAGLALAQLFDRTRNRRYLDGAVAIGEWIKGRPSPFHFGGYHGGVQADGTTAQRWCSTEHNIDVYALFQLLGRHTRNRDWYQDANVARDFVRSMWNPAGGYFWTGTQGGNPGDDPNLINKSILPEDVNTWAYLSLRDRAHARGIDWTAAKLGNVDGGPESQLPEGVTIAGVTFSDQSKVLTGTVPNGDRPNDRNAVWLEGNGHMAAALLERNRHGDRGRAVHYLLETVKAQELLGGGQTVGLTSDPINGRLSNPGDGGNWTGTALPARSGIVSATSAFDTGFGFGYFQRQHVGATSWFLMGAQGVNPYNTL
ncbi:MAG TPA: hypothetical protein DGT23_16690 [Micromonosporaceae bacterium]|nr:hypothetical protein [Micromonosporaceae bacterium]